MATMDRNRYTNSLLGLDDYTTADILNQPLRRGILGEYDEGPIY